jgi:signal transduction histidine kinase
MSLPLHARQGVLRGLLAAHVLSLAVLAALLDQPVHQHGLSGAVPLLAGGRDEHGVWITISNEGRVLDLTATEELFEPFTQLDAGTTRHYEGIGVGLYLVRRLVDVYGGSVHVRSEEGWTTVEVRLQAAGSSSPRTTAQVRQPA